MVFSIEFKRFWMNENTVERFAWYLLSILSVFEELKHFWSLRNVLSISWRATILLNHSYGKYYRFWVLSDDFKFFRMVFAIDFEHFRINENNFEAFGWYFLSSFSGFGWPKTLLRHLHGICYEVLKRFRIKKKTIKASLY